MSMVCSSCKSVQEREDWTSIGMFSSDRISSSISPRSPWLIQCSGLRQQSIARGTLLPHNLSVMHSTMVLASVHYSRMLASPGFCWNLLFIPGLHCCLMTFSHFLLSKFWILEESCLHSKAVEVFIILFAVVWSPKRVALQCCINCSLEW